MAEIPQDLKQMFEDSKLDTTMFVGSDIRMLIMRVAKSESWADELSAELDKGDSWAWIRRKFEKCRTQFKWYTPRTDSLANTRYEVMGWLHVLFAHADPKVYIDIAIEHQKKADETEVKFVEHTKAVGKFLSELYAIMVDPLEDGERKVAETCEILLNRAADDREIAKEYRDKVVTLTADNERLTKELSELRKGYAESIEARTN